MAHPVCSGGAAAGPFLSGLVGVIEGFCEAEFNSVVLQTARETASKNQEKGGEHLTK